jgi:PKD repeat protein
MFIFTILYGYGKPRTTHIPDCDNIDYSKINNCKNNKQDIFYNKLSGLNSNIVLKTNSLHSKIIKSGILYNNYLDDFSLIYPNNGITLNDSSITFAWNNKENFVSYSLIISCSENFEGDNILYNIDNIINNNYTLTISADCDTLFWKVVGYNDDNTEHESEVFKFTIFTPLDADNLQTWYYADSVNIVDAAVSLWYDLSPNNLNLEQSVVARRPVKIDNVLNGHSVINFDGDNDYLTVNFENTISQPNAFFVVWKANTSSGNQFAYDGNSTGSRNSLSVTPSMMRINNGTNITYESSVPFENYILSSVISNTTNSKAYENGILKIVGNAGNHSLSGLRTGIAYNGTSPLNGDIAELIFYNRIVEDDERQIIEKYLMDKYAPPVNLGYDINMGNSFCDTVIKTANKSWFTNYLWNTGETSQEITANRSGIYSVTVTDIFGRQSYDTINIHYPVVNQLTDTIVCYANQILWDTQLEESSFSFEWINRNEITSEITISEEGDYAVIITDNKNCKFYSDTILFSFDNYEITASLGGRYQDLCTGNKLSLVSNSEETVFYLWNDGSTGPEIPVTGGGDYSVMVTNTRGCVAKDTVTVNILGIVPVPDFTNSGHCEKNAIQFIDESTSSDGNINGWLWKINEDVFTDQNVDYIFDESGVYDISLTVYTDNGCSNKIGIPVTVYPLPEISFIPEFFCQNQDIEFYATSEVENGIIIDNNWILNDDIIMNGSHITYRFNEEGFNSMKLISVSNFGCKDSVSKEFYVRNAPLPQFITKNACEGETTYFINTTETSIINPGEEWMWNFGDGTSSILSNPEHTYPGAGTFLSELQIRYANNCVIKNQIPVEIYYSPEVLISGLEACLKEMYQPEIIDNSQSGEIIYYYWKLGDSLIQESFEKNPSFIISEPGNIPISLEVRTNYSCNYVANDFVTVRNKPESDFIPSVAFGAIPLSVDFENLSEGAIYYTWDFGDNNISTEKNPTHIFEDEGNFEIVLASMSEYGCSDTSYASVRTVIPVIDLVLYDIRTELIDGYLKIWVNLINNSNINISDIELTLNLGNGKKYREIIDKIDAGNIITYLFSAEPFVYDKNNIDFICIDVWASILEIYSDKNVENNSICDTYINNIKIYDPYPNPSSNIINCEVISSQNTNLDISIVDINGNIVYNDKIKDFIGYINLEINISNFSKGIYFLRVISGNEVKNSKIEIISF